VFSILLEYYNQGNRTFGGHKDSFERWVDLALRSSRALRTLCITVTRNSGTSGGASVGGGIFPDFIATMGGDDIYLECKSVKGNTAEILDNSTISSGKYRTSDGRVVDVHYLYCNYEPTGNAILRLAVINGEYYGDNPDLLDSISDFVFSAIQDKIVQSGSYWSASRGQRGAIYIEDVGPFESQQLRCRVRQMYHSGNPFRAFDYDFFCITTRASWNSFRWPSNYPQPSFNSSALRLDRKSGSAPLEFVILVP